MKKWAWVFILACAAVAAEANPYVLLPGNRRIEGVSIRARRDGTVILTTAQGQEFTFSSDQYLQAVADRPAEFDESLRLIQAGRYDEAITRLRGIVEQYRFLSWDEQALNAMARAHMGKGDARGALQSYEALFRVNPRREEDREIRWGYYATMLQAGQPDALLPKLDEIIRSGEPTEAVRAYVMRGDVHESRNRLEDAVLDYLRAVMFFRRQTDIMPETYLRVAQTLEKMRDNRSREWYRNILEEFPNSPQAAAARAKL